MPLYFFHLIDGHAFRDLEGSEVSNLATAQEEAVVYLGQTIKDNPGLLKATGELRVEVTGEDGALLTTVIVHAIDAMTPDAIREKTRL